MPPKGRSKKRLAGAALESHNKKHKLDKYAESRNPGEPANETNDVGSGLDSDMCREESSGVGTPATGLLSPPTGGGALPQLQSIVQAGPKTFMSLPLELQQDIFREAYLSVDDGSPNGAMRPPEFLLDNTFKLPALLSTSKQLYLSLGEFFFNNASFIGKIGLEDRNITNSETFVTLSLLSLKLSEKERKAIRNMRLEIHCATSQPTLYGLANLASIFNIQFPRSAEYVKSEKARIAASARSGQFKRTGFNFSGPSNRMLTLRLNTLVKLVRDRGWELSQAMVELNETEMQDRIYRRFCVRLPKEKVEGMKRLQRPSQPEVNFLQAALRRKYGWLPTRDKLREYEGKDDDEELYVRDAERWNFYTVDW